MANVTLRQHDEHVAWLPGEILTVKVVLIDPDGDYVCETLETYPPDLKQKHTAELAAKQVELDAAKAATPPPTNEKGEPMPVAEKPKQGLPVIDVTDPSLAGKPDAP